MPIKPSNRVSLPYLRVADSLRFYAKKEFLSASMAGSFDPLSMETHSKIFKDANRFKHVVGKSTCERYARDYLFTLREDFHKKSLCERLSLKAKHFVISNFNNLFSRNDP